MLFWLCMQTEQALCWANHILTYQNHLRCLRRILSMARFGSVESLAAFLGKLDPDYAEHAAALWQKKVRTPQQLANASKSLLLSWGLLDLHVNDINPRAGDTGEQVAHSILQLRCMRTLSCSTYSKCSHSGSNNTMCKHLVSEIHSSLQMPKSRSYSLLMYQSCTLMTFKQELVTLVSKWPTAFLLQHDCGTTLRSTTHSKYSHSGSNNIHHVMQGTEVLTPWTNKVHQRRHAQVSERRQS